MVTNSPALPISRAWRYFKELRSRFPPPTRKHQGDQILYRIQKEMQFLINYDACILPIRNWRRQHHRRLLSNLSKSSTLKPFVISLLKHVLPDSII